MKLRFSGTGAAAAVPAFFCDCVACAEAKSQACDCRSRASVLLEGKVNCLLDASPNLRTQPAHEKLDWINGLLLTQAHFDHFGWIGEFEKLCTRPSRRGNPGLYDQREPGVVGIEVQVYEGLSLHSHMRSGFRVAAERYKLYDTWVVNFHLTYDGRSIEI